MKQGTCHGGPMDGLRGQSRFAKGFVVLDVLSRRACVYDAHGTGFVARTADDYDEEKAEKAAAGDTYDVRAYDPEHMREW